MRKTTRKKIAPIVVTVLVILYMIPLIVLALLALGYLGRESRAAALPLAGYVILGGAVIVGVIAALLQRLREIDGGEEDDAGRY